MQPDGKVSIGSYPLVYPIPVVLAGANVAGMPNYETLGNCAIGGFNPGLVIISSVRTHYTNQGIRENGTFSVNFPTQAMREVTDFCGIASGRRYDKGSLFANFYGELGTAPMIAECPVNLECKVLHAYEHAQMEIFTGLVVNAFVDRQFATWVEPPVAEEQKEEKADAPPEATGRWVFSRASLPELAPLIYHLDYRYYAIGKATGQGFRDGKGVYCAERLR